MSIESFCDVMALLRKAPRTKRELVVITGLDQSTVLDYLKAMHSEGHLRIIGTQRRATGGKPADIYEWLEPIHGGGND